MHDILQSCDLFGDVHNPTISKLIRTKHQESQKHRVLSAYRRHGSQQEQVYDFPDFDYAFSERKMSYEHNQPKQPENLRSWLRQNLHISKSRLDSSKALREENRSLRESMCSRYGLQDIGVDPDWTAATVKGHLLCLQKALECVDVAGLSKVSGAGGLRFVLGHRSRVSVEGKVHLSCEDTLQQWVQVRALD